ncbi:hypothetical protein [Alkalicoccus daliensis]|uniref:Uncharacterized protein n=1 Tax=Alkalicoccus daliensis TaxID=745820 RepID=A0A1H0AQR9_9BACI|nr:hypothetical protein [Alkalicoccus daliensis]SDN35725.1 hypothetical protein SAMN04488053_101577 [Alkalicoccus daliensis]
MAVMNWRDKLTEQSWLLPFLPSYMKPLDEPGLMNEHTREFVYEAEEFISDLAALSELPRVNKTFKRSIQGFTYKIKIKQRKIHVEMIDTQKSASAMKKRVFITMFRSHIKQESGTGKLIDSTIYFQKDGKTQVRSVRKHPLFQSIFYHVHRLDLSIAGEPLPKELPQSEPVAQSTNMTIAQEAASLVDALSDAQKRFKHLDHPLLLQLDKMYGSMQKTSEEYSLLDVEEKHHLKRMILHDIPNLLQTYDSLSNEQKKESYPRVQQSLLNMFQFIDKQANDLQATRMERMEHLLQLNDLRYDPNLPRENEKTSTMMRRHQKQIDND